MGNSTTIQCVVLSSLDGITIKWTNTDGKEISSNNALVISNITPQLQNTKYTCTAVIDTNPMSCVAKNKTFVLNVKGIVNLLSFVISYCNGLNVCVETFVESVSMEPQESFLINSSFIIDCIITLNTPVGPDILLNVTWYHNMNNITHNSLLKRNSNTVFTSKLTIHSVQVSDIGVYHCNAGIDSKVTTNNISVCITGMVYMTIEINNYNLFVQLMRHYHQ